MLLLVVKQPALYYCSSLFRSSFVFTFFLLVDGYIYIYIYIQLFHCLVYLFIYLLYSFIPNSQNIYIYF